MFQHPAYQRQPFIGFVLVAVLCSVPLVSFAKTDMESAIRASLLSDPRASQISNVEFEALVAALVAQAESESVQPDEIAFRGMQSADTAASNFRVGFGAVFAPALVALIVLGSLYFILRHLKSRVRHA